MVDEGAYEGMCPDEFVIYSDKVVQVARDCYYDASDTQTYYYIGQ